MGQKVTSTCLSMLNSGNSVVVVNDTNLVLIPKKKTPTCVVDYRLIILWNMVYKLVTKITTNRMKVLFLSLISNQQSTFILRRLITSNVITAFELLHTLSKKNNRSKGFIALTFDMSKAYDGSGCLFAR